MASRPAALSSDTLPEPLTAPCASHLRMLVPKFSTLVQWGSMHSYNVKAALGVLTQQSCLLVLCLCFL